MGLIYNYPNDVEIQDDDAWVGTNAENKRTSQFTAQKVADYLNVNGKIYISNQLGFRFRLQEYAGVGKMSFAGGGGNETPFSSITELIVSSRDISNQYVPNFLAILVGSQILISHKDDIDTFGHYTVNSYIVSADPNFYTLQLTPSAGNNTIIENELYFISSLNLSAGGGGDKNFVYTQGTPAATWNITHTLNKYPSIEVVDSIGNIVIPAVQYNSLTSITLFFSAGFSGKAYLN